MDSSRRLLARSEAALVPERLRPIRRSPSARGRKPQRQGRYAGWRSPPPLLPEARRLYRPHEPLLLARGGDGECATRAPVQPDRHRRSSLGDVRLQLLFPTRVSRWPRRIAAAPLSRGVRVVEIRQGMGTGTREVALGGQLGEFRMEAPSSFDVKMPAQAGPCNAPALKRFLTIVDEG